MHPPCSKDSGPHEKVDRKTQFSGLDLDNFSECFKELTELLFTKIACIGIRYAYFAILGSVMPGMFSGKCRTGPVWKKHVQKLKLLKNQHFEI